MDDNVTMDGNLEREPNFCICGKLIDPKKENCERESCIKSYEKISSSINKYFDVFDNKFKAFELFESFGPGIQAGILTELEDDLFMEYIQILGQEKILRILQIPSDSLRLRFLEYLEPKLAKEINLEFKSKKFDTEGLMNYFLNLINLVLLSFQKK